MKEFLKSIGGTISTIGILLAVLLIGVLTDWAVVLFIFINWRRRIKLSIDPMMQLKKRNIAL